MSSSRFVKVNARVIVASSKQTSRRAVPVAHSALQDFGEHKTKEGAWWESERRYTLVVCNWLSYSDP